MSAAFEETRWYRSPEGVPFAAEFPEQAELFEGHGWEPCDPPNAEQLAEHAEANQRRADADAEARERQLARDREVKEQARQQQAARVAAEISKAQDQS